MTEAEWLTCVDPKAMLGFLKGRTSDRKLRLFAVACCYRIVDLLTPESRAALEVAHRFAEGMASGLERKLARASALSAGWVIEGRVKHARGPAKASVCDALRRRAYEAAVCTESRSGVASRQWAWNQLHYDTGVAWNAERSAMVKAAECEAHATLLRDIFGNPFHAVRGSWLAPAVASMAQRIYDDAAFGRMPELAEALEAAGCIDADVLEHCRRPDPHVRGCWVVDLVLGKE
jgi:hypothetical protein